MFGLCRATPLVPLEGEVVRGCMNTIPAPNPAFFIQRLNSNTRQNESAAYCFVAECEYNLSLK